MGLIDGDGYIAITKIGLDNIRMELIPARAASRCRY